MVTLGITLGSLNCDFTRHISPAYSPVKYVKSLEQVCGKLCEEICGKITENEYDVFCMQQIHGEHVSQIFKSQLEDLYPYSTFYADSNGCGLLTLSKHRIVSSFFQRFQLGAGLLSRRDGGTGCSVAMIKREDGKIFTVINTHFPSVDLSDNKLEIPGSDSDVENRTLNIDGTLLHNVFELASLARFSANTSDVTLLTADFPAATSDLPLRLLRSMGGGGGGLRDAFMAGVDGAGRRGSHCDTLSQLMEPVYLDFALDAPRPLHLLVSHNEQRAHIKVTRCAVQPWTCKWARPAGQPSHAIEAHVDFSLKKKEPRVGATCSDKECNLDTCTGLECRTRHETKLIADWLTKRCSRMNRNCVMCLQLDILISIVLLLVFIFCPFKSLTGISWLASILFAVYFAFEAHREKRNVDAFTTVYETMSRKK